MIISAGEAGARLSCAGHLEQEVALVVVEEEEEDSMLLRPLLELHQDQEEGRGGGRSRGSERSKLQWQSATIWQPSG
jgi:hypothetical protein